MELALRDLDPLSDDGQFALYRALWNDKQVLALALVASEPTATAIARLEHEYALAGVLDPDWAVRPLELGSYERFPILVLQDDGGEPLARLVGQPLDTTKALQLAIGVTTALEQIHRHGLVHKDIKPSNALVDRTGNVRLTGFGIASRQAGEHQAPVRPEIIAGTLAYMAPEQTGRMNRPVDARSDLYSLGVTIYEMLCGVLPFTASDPMAWVHSHIARQAVPPSERTATVPRQLSRIVMKLLAKTGEERYQSAQGLEADLRRCLAEWETVGCIEAFPLGLHEISKQLTIPDTLYGRERELESLIAAFDRAATSGKVEMVLLSGYSGVGKSSLVDKLRKTLVPARSTFAAGKFEALKRHSPYATLANAFQALVRQLLARPEAEVNEWRKSLQTALGFNARLIMNLIPELELALGEQPPVAELPPRDEQSRFQTVFRRFLSVFAQSDRPLVLFLDDLQSADTATLDLIVHLATHNEVRNLLLVGAYRDNEVVRFHPLLLASDAIREAGGQIGHIALAPLPPTNLCLLVADALRCDRDTAQPLADLIHEKTDGNPFFAIQFLVTLADDGLLEFDPEQEQWTWDLIGIRSRGFSDNVADLMAAKLGRLPDRTQNALRQFACLGNIVNGATLAVVNGTSEEALRATLWDALWTGLVSDTDGSYAFIHDRVHEAAYALLADDERALTHLALGRLLASPSVPGARDERIFDIVNQFSRGLDLIVSPEEQVQVAELNLIAARRAKAATAYQAARTFLSTAHALLPEDRWTRCPALAFSIGLTLAECDYRSGDPGAAENRLATLYSHTLSISDDAAIVCLRINIHADLGRFGQANELAAEFLRKAGVTWQYPATEQSVRLEYDQLFDRIGSRSIESLVELPPITDPVARTTMDVLAQVNRCAVFSDQDLLRANIGRMANLSLQHGNGDGTCLAFVWVGVVLAGHFDDFQTAHRFGKAGLELSERPGRGSYSFKALAYLDFANRVAPWVQHLRLCRPGLQVSFEAAQERSETVHAAYSRSALITNLLASGEPLGDVQREAEKWHEFARQGHANLTRNLLAIQLSFVAALRGTADNSDVTLDMPFEDGAVERRSDGTPRVPVVLCSYWISRLQAWFHAGRFADAEHAASRAEPLLWTLPSHVELADYHFYAALTRAALQPSVPAEAQSHHMDTLRQHHQRFAVWATTCPENFASQAALIAAEIARLEGRDVEAMRLYDDAIRSAQTHGFVQNEGVACELAARFYTDRNFSLIANAYFSGARNCYLRWDARQKVRQLDDRHPMLRPRPTLFVPTATSGTHIEELDLNAMLKASQAISSEIVLDALIETLMRIAVEHAGAERGVLVLLRDGEPQVAAEVVTDRGPVEVTLREAPVSPTDLPDSALHYVLRTHQSLVIDDASASDLLSNNAYVQQHAVRSVLCLPIIKQANLVGALYLENNLSPRVFTSNRVSVLEFLASQAAISLENTYLYADLQRSEAFLADGQRMSRTGTWRLTVRTGRLQWSDEHCRIFGYDVAEKHTLTLESFIARVHPEDAPGVLQALDSAVQDGRELTLDFRLALPDGAIKHVHGTGRPVRDGAGSVAAFVGTTIDMTERRLAEDALRIAQADLARAARLATMGELTAMIAHEVGQPLMAIVANAGACVSWLNNAEPNLDEARQAAARITENAHRAGAIIRGVRALARKATPDMAAFDAGDAIEEILTLMSGELRRQGVLLQTELSDGLDPVIGDRVQVQQVVLNLIVNGIEAMNAVTDRPRVLRISTLSDPVGMLVAVADSGTGFDPTHADRIFEGFFTTKPDGIGVGLAISRSIVAAHGGVLWAAPNQPHGSVFQFTLPVSAEARKSNAAP